MIIKDYVIMMQDGNGNIVELTILGDCILEMIEAGDSEADARESVESNKFANAIERGEIGADAWLLARID